MHLASGLVHAEALCIRVYIRLIYAVSDDIWVMIYGMGDDILPLKTSQAVQMKHVTAAQHHLQVMIIEMEIIEMEINNGSESRQEIATAGFV